MYAQTIDFWKQLSKFFCFRTSLLGVYSALLCYVFSKMMRANLRNLNLFWVGVFKRADAGQTDSVLNESVRFRSHEDRLPDLSLALDVWLLFSFFSQG